ncbi:MAG TPA: glycosyltransferase [Pirellulales bacterium]|nr:glycosyltransferase [Pirellulales bacterium]
MEQPSSASEVGEPLRIALCITELEVGGAERCLVELASRIDRSRFLPVVYALSPPPGPGVRSLLPQLEQAGVETHFLGASGVRHLPGAIRNLAKLLKRQRPIVLQSFLFHANFVSRFAARLAGVPHVFSGVRVAERGIAWHLWLDRISRGLVERYVCVSGAVADFSRARLGLSEHQVVVIPNGIDAGRFASAEALDLTTLGLPAGRRAVTYIGRLEMQKGVTDLIEHSRLWLDRLPEHDLLIVGTGPLENELRAISERLAIAARVYFAGWRADVPEILKASDLVVLPSRWEGMPNVVLEAMAAGRPVVSTDVEGVRDLLGDASARQIVPVGNSAELAARIVSLVSDGRVLGEISSLNLSRSKEFGLEAMVRSYERLFAESAAAAAPKA